MAPVARNRTSTTSLGHTGRQRSRRTGRIAKTHGRGLWLRRLLPSSWRAGSVGKRHVGKPRHLALQPLEKRELLTVSELRISDGAAIEAATSANFLVWLSEPSTSTITVDYATSNGTATAGADYTSTSGTLTFTAGQTTKTISVPLGHDTDDESSLENFSLTLTNPTNATIVDGVAQGSILDDDVYGYYYYYYFYCPNLSALIDSQGWQAVTCLVVIEACVLVADQATGFVVGNFGGRVA